MATHCSTGRHKPARARVLIHPTADSVAVQSYCSHCRATIVKSPITRRWRVTGLLG